VIANDLRLDIGWIYAKVHSEVRTKPEAVEKRASTEHALMAGCNPRDISEGIGGIGNSDEHRLRGGLYDLGNDLTIDGCIFFQQSQPSQRIAAIRCTAGLFVDAGGNEHHADASQRVIVAM
jgi:hypothetical protein